MVADNTSIVVQTQRAAQERRLHQFGTLFLNFSNCAAPELGGIYQQWAYQGLPQCHRRAGPDTLIISADPKKVCRAMLRFGDGSINLGFPARRVLEYNRAQVRVGRFHFHRLTKQLPVTLNAITALFSPLNWKRLRFANEVAIAFIRGSSVWLLARRTMSSAYMSRANCLPAIQVPRPACLISRAKASMKVE